MQKVISLTDYKVKKMIARLGDSAKNIVENKRKRERLLNDITKDKE